MRSRSVFPQSLIMHFGGLFSLFSPASPAWHHNLLCFGIIYIVRRCHQIAPSRQLTSFTSSPISQTSQHQVALWKTFELVPSYYIPTFTVSFPVLLPQHYSAAAPGAYSFLSMNNPAIMELPTDDNLHDDVNFDDDNALHLSIQTYQQPHMAVLDALASTILSQSPSSTDSNSRTSYNAAKFPPHLLRRLPRALPQPLHPQHLQTLLMPSSGPNQGSSDDLLGHLDRPLHSPLGPEPVQLSTNQEQHGMAHEFLPTTLLLPTHSYSGSSMLNYQSKLTQPTQMQPPMLYQLTPLAVVQMPKNPLQIQPQPQMQLLNFPSQHQLYQQQIADQGAMQGQYQLHLSQLAPIHGSQHLTRQLFPQLFPNTMPLQVPANQSPITSHQQYSSSMPLGSDMPYSNQIATYSETSSSSMLPHNEDETGEGGKPKVAPRSVDLFRVGPPFSDTIEHHPIFRSDTHERLVPQVQARIDRGFELASSGNWIGYKRNYFTLVAAFDLDIDFATFANSGFYTIRNTEHGQENVPIKHFAISIQAKCSETEAQVSLVQHTPKRDKGPQNPPSVFAAVPGTLPDHQTVKESCNKRNDTKLELMKRIFNFDRKNYLTQHGEGSFLRNYPDNSIARVARFERIQFTKSIRTKGSNMAQKYFSLSAKLLAIVPGSDQQDEQIVLACSKTPGLLVRGRSPSKYHTEKTSGYRGPSDSEN